MIESKKNKCRGSNKAIGYGCGIIDFRYKFGLCKTCFFVWLNKSKEGKDYAPILIKTTLNKVKKESKVTRKYVKWDEKPLKEMIQYVQFNIVNPYIKFRDIACYGRCISSNNSIVDAGHFYPTTISTMRFVVSNIHGQNDSDNRFKAGNLAAYKEGLIQRHGLSYFNTLERLKQDSINWPKLDKIELIRIGKTYEHLTKKSIWCFTHLEFNNYKNILNK